MAAVISVAVDDYSYGLPGCPIPPILSVCYRVYMLCVRGAMLLVVAVLCITWELLSVGVMLCSSVAAENFVVGGEATYIHVCVLPSSLRALSMLQLMFIVTRGSLSCLISL